MAKKTIATALKVATLLPLTKQEMHVLLRSLAIANDSDRTVAGDRAVNTWLAQRILRVLESQG